MGIYAIYGSFLPSRRFDATPRGRSNVSSCFVRGVVPDYRSPLNVGRPAGVAVVGTCADDQKVEKRDKFPTSGTNTPSTFRCDDV